MKIYHIRMNEKYWKLCFSYIGNMILIYYPSDLDINMLLNTSCIILV